MVSYNCKVNKEVFNESNLNWLQQKSQTKETWNNVYVDQYVENGEEYIKVFVTRHDLENRHFNLAGIDFDGESYRIVEKTFEEKRPKYAICKVVKEAAS